jgi:hypothetical protein
MQCNTHQISQEKERKKERRECISKNETPIGISIYANIKHEINHELKFHKLQRR